MQPRPDGDQPGRQDDKDPTRELSHRPTIIFLTAGEMPSPTNLVYSQVLRSAVYLKKSTKYRDVLYVCYVPLSSLVASCARFRPADLDWMKRLPVASFTFLSLVNLDFKILYLLRKLLIRHDARKLAMVVSRRSDSAFILHCRSYVAAHLAIEVKRLVPSKCIKVLFDMRSILPPEFVFMMGKAGRFLYSSGKEWERWLLKNADLSLLPSVRGIELLRLENPDIKVRKINILGIDVHEKSSIAEQFEKRWERKEITYVGSVGQWNPERMVTTCLLCIQQAFPECDISVISGNYRGRGVKHRVLGHEAMEDCYRNMLASVVPGLQSNGYFESLKMSTNFFSTKAAEALSCSVPLIVNEAIREVAELVGEYECGIVFKVSDAGEVIFSKETLADLGSKEYWRRLTLNAQKTARDFSFRSVMTEYEEYYQMILRKELG